jgi:hypothetical protein
MRGFSFSLKRFLGITQVKQQIARQRGIPTSKKWLGIKDWWCGVANELKLN